MWKMFCAYISSILKYLAYFIKYTAITFFKKVFRTSFIIIVNMSCIFFQAIIMYNSLKKFKTSNTHGEL